MYLVQTTTIRPNHEYYEECDKLCFLSKNVYNVALYNVRQHFFKTGKYLSYEDNYKLMRYGVDYLCLPDKVSKQTMMLVNKNFMSFFKLLKLKNSGDYNKPVHISKYLDKVNGRQVVTYEKNAINIRNTKKTNTIKLSKTNIIINIGKLKLDDIKQVRIVPAYGYFNIEIVYVVNAPNKKVDNGRYCSIDLGVNNLATITSNVIAPIIINGRPLKSVNQFYNKERARLQSCLPKETYTSERLKRLTSKRYFKIDDYLHNAAKYIVNHLVSNDINTIVVGYNKEWKQDTNIGKVNNQNFVNIPFLKFIKILTYKCDLEGINVIIHEESYTSKCSFIDNESLCFHDVYLGKRIKRGLFETANGYLINADINASLNILRKVLVGFCYDPNNKIIIQTPTIVTL